jgi:hypothetical protein
MNGKEKEKIESEDAKKEAKNIYNCNCEICLQILSELKNYHIIDKNNKKVK